MRKIIQILVLVIFVFQLCACEAFVRKFTRKKKTSEIKPEEMVLSPQEYEPPQTTKEEKYRQYFLYWRAWHDELLDALSDKTNRKKQLSSADEAIKNLADIRPLLSEKKQAQLDKYILDLTALKDDIFRDYYGSNIPFYRQRAERIRLNIMKDFSYSALKEDLKQ